MNDREGTNGLTTAEAEISKNYCATNSGSPEVKLILF
jgi:hypothetical protein